MDWIHMQVDSEAARTPLPLDVLVPDAEQKGPYKAVFLLHDLAGNNTSWMRSVPLERYLGEMGAVLVMPSCLNSFYVNMYYGYDMQDYLVRDLVRMCETWFRMDARREARLIAGIGMGGYGAVHTALAAPDVFGAAVSIDGMLDPGRFFDSPLPAIKMEDVFGPKEYYERSPHKLANAAAALAHNPANHLYPEITLCGEGDGQEELLQALRESGIHAEAAYDEDPMAVLAEKVRLM